MWLTPQATEMTPEDWAFPEARFLAYVLGAGKQGSAPLFIILNAGVDPVEFIFPEFLEFENWKAVLMTADNGAVTSPFHVGATSQAESRSISVYEGLT